MKMLFTGAALAVALSVAACATTPTSTQVDSAITNAQTVLLAAKTTVDQDVSAGIITSATASQIDGYITAADQALSGAQAAYAAGDATTEQQKVADVLTAVTQINAAILTAIQTHNAAK